MKGSTWGWIILGVIFLGGLQSILRMNSDSAPTMSGGPDPQITVTAQDAEGFSQRDMGVEFLKNYEDWIRTRSAHIVGKHVSAGELKTLGQLQIRSNFIERDGVKLAMFRFHYPNARLRIVQAVGFAGAEQKTVSCQWENADFPPVASGACGRKINEVFGVNLDTPG